MDPGTMLVMRDSTVIRKHTTRADAVRDRYPDEAWESSFIAMYGQSCVPEYLIHDLELKITNTTFSGVPGVAEYKGIADQGYVYVDDPESLTMCRVSQTDRICPETHLNDRFCCSVCASTQDVTDIEY